MQSPHFKGELEGTDPTQGAWHVDKNDVLYGPAQPDMAVKPSDRGEYSFFSWKEVLPDRANV